MEIIIIVCALILGIIIAVIAMTSKQESVKKEIEFSDDILLELSIKQELGNRYEIIPCIIKIYKNKNVELIMENNVIGTYLLDELKYTNLITNLDLNKINDLSIKSNYSIKNGYEYFIILFDKSGNPINRIGGYEPVNQEFNNYRNMILNCLPNNFIGERRNAYIERLKGNR